MDFDTESEYEYDDETLAISYATLLTLSAFSNLFCWPIGMVATWKILQVICGQSTLLSSTAKAVTLHTEPHEVTFYIKA